MSPRRVGPLRGGPSSIDPMPDLVVSALGGLRIHVNGVPLSTTLFTSSKPAELLVLILCRPGGVSREDVGLTFWPDASKAQVKNSFHVLLHRLRRALGQANWVKMEGDRYRLDPGLAVDFDALRFERAAEILLRSSTGDSPDALLSRLDEVLAIYGGEFLEGTPAGDWHLDRRGRLRRLHGDLLRMRAEHVEVLGPPAEAAESWRVVLGHDPLDEEACRALMRCEVRRGRRTEALRAYDTFVRLLREELGARPEPETEALAESLRLASQQR